jgi:hypothetical protein
MNKEQITIDKDFFCHLLDCLGLQKMLLQRGNPLGLIKEEKDFNQGNIDKALKKGMFILNLPNIQKEHLVDLLEKFYKEYYNTPCPEEHRDERREHFMCFLPVEHIIIKILRSVCYEKARIDLDTYEYGLGKINKAYLKELLLYEEEATHKFKELGLEIEE